MTPKVQGWTIVIVGHWNRAIFSPGWVGNRVFGEAQVEVLVATMPVAPVIYRAPLVELQVSHDRVILHPRELTDEALRQAEQTAATILDALPDTPLTAIGVNFAFIETDLSEELLDLFNLRDAEGLFQNGWDISQRKLARRLTRDEMTLNLTLTLQAEERSVEIECNFHKDVPPNAIGRDASNIALSAIRERVLRLRDTALHLLDEVYHLAINEEAQEGAEA